MYLKITKNIGLFLYSMGLCVQIATGQSMHLNNLAGNRKPQTRVLTKPMAWSISIKSFENALKRVRGTIEHLELMANGLKPTFHHHEQENRPIYDSVTGVFFYDGLVVLHSTTAPAVLLESAVITNPEDEQKANDKAYRNRITNAIVNAVIKYCDATAARAQLHTAPPPQPAQRPSSAEKQGSRK